MRGRGQRQRARRRRAKGDPGRRHANAGPGLLRLRDQQRGEVWNAEWRRHTLARALDEARAQFADGHTFTAYEMYALEGLPPNVVAERLRISIDSVYQAKTRVMNALRRRIRQWEWEREEDE